MDYHVQHNVSSLEEREKVRVSDCPNLPDRISWKEGRDRKKTFGKGKPSQHASFFSRVSVQRKGTGNHLSVSFIKKGIVNMRTTVRSSTRNGWERTKQTKDFCGSGQNIGSLSSRGEDDHAKIHCKGRPSARCHMLRILSRSSDCLAAQNVLVKEREQKGHTLGIIQQGRQSSRSSNALSYEQL